MTKQARVPLTPARLERTLRPGIPPRLLPIFYVALAHASLTLAFAALALDPRAVAGFYYHPRMLALVHLVTLGWITGSILGALYIVGPVALRTWFRAGRADYAAAALFAIGMIGIVGHFWIQKYEGMAWSGAAAAAGIVMVGLRLAGPLRRAPVPAAVRVHIGLAFLNIAAAAVMGVLLGINKVHPILPGFVLTNVYAHAHLAAIGWASMMVVGVGYRLLPMVLPAEMPGGPAVWATAILLQLGSWGLFASFLLVRPLWPFACTIVAGFAVFFTQVAKMLRRRRPRPPAIASPDPAVLHAGGAFVSLAMACAMGLWLSIAAPSTWGLRAATAYGVLGLLGFLAQMVVGMEARLMPLLAWYWASAHAAGQPVLSPHVMPWRGGQKLVFPLWLFGVPALAAGLAFDALPLVRAAACSLLVATVVGSAQTVLILRHAFSQEIFK